MTVKDQDLDSGWAIARPEHVIIFEQARPFLLTRWNALHTRISYHAAVALMEKVGGDPKVVIPAILLHDIGWHMIPEDQLAGAFGPRVTKPELQRLHETEGARMAGKILGDLKYPANRIREIEEIISGHDTRMEPLDLNDAVVKDADKLWRYSYEGFTIDCQRFDKTPQVHLAWLAGCIPKWFFTETAQAMAHSEMLQRKID